MGSLSFLFLLASVILVVFSRFKDTEIHTLHLHLLEPHTANNVVVQ